MSEKMTWEEVAHTLARYIEHGDREKTCDSCPVGWSYCRSHEMACVDCNHTIMAWAREQVGEDA